MKSKLNTYQAWKYYIVESIIHIFYFLTLNINTYVDIICAKCLSLFLPWIYVMCFTMNHYKFQSAKNVIHKWTLVVKYFHQQIDKLQLNITLIEPKL